MVKQNRPDIEAKKSDFESSTKRKRKKKEKKEIGKRGGFWIMGFWKTDLPRWDFELMFEKIKMNRMNKNEEKKKLNKKMKKWTNMNKIEQQYNEQTCNTITKDEQKWKNDQKSKMAKKKKSLSVLCQSPSWQRFWCYYCQCLSHNRSATTELSRSGSLLVSWQASSPRGPCVPFAVLPSTDLPLHRRNRLPRAANGFALS